MNVLLLDGSGLAYRSYFAFARNPLRTRGGEETGLTFAFMNTLLRLLQRYAPDAGAVVFDAPGPTFRHALHGEYKAGRRAMPEEMRRQLPRLHAALDAMHLPVLQQAGIEADDVLGTLARRFEAEAAHVYIVTGDKDLQQLLSGRIRLVRFNRAGGDMNEYGPDELHADLGITPDQMVDYLSLSGDSIDNVPGVPGVGEKTAAQLVRDFGSLDALFADLDRVARPALRAKLAAGRETALRARDLVRIRTDALEVGLDSLRWRPPDWERVRALLRELEFFQLLRMVPEPAQRIATNLETSRVETQAQLDAMCSALSRAPRIAMQWITAEPSEKRGAPGGLGVAASAERAFVVRFAAAPVAVPGQLAFASPAGSGLPLDAVLAVLAPILADPAVQKVGHDIKRDLRLLTDAGTALEGTLFDTMLASYVLNPARRTHQLQALALEFLDLRVEDDRGLFERGARERDLRALPAERLAAWIAAQTHAIWLLAERFAALLEAEKLMHVFADVEMPLVRVLAHMEQRGVRVDVVRLREIAVELGQRARGLEDRIHALAGHAFNINSPQQLGDVLFGELHLPHARRTKTGWSTDVAVLEGLAEEHEIPRLVLDYRQLVKLQSTYAEALPRLVHAGTGRIHTCFNQAVASTGRLSSSDPNLQNIPVRTDLGRRIREAFVPAAGHVLLSADYSQIELRIMAHLSQDRGLLQAFRDGVDVHTSTAARIAGCRPADVTQEQRGAAKTVNFGVLYGMGARGLAQQLDIPLDEARRFIEEYFATYPGVRAYTRDVVERARAQGYVTTLLGRRLPLPDLNSSHPAQRAFAERVAVNAPIQGSAADIIKLAMVRLERELAAARTTASMILQVHDELLLECDHTDVPRVRPLVRQAMEGVATLAVPLVVEVGSGANWAQAH